MDNCFKITSSYIYEIGRILLTIVGLFGNSLVFYILSRPKFIKEMIFRYFIISEVVGCLNIILVWLLLIPSLTNWNFPVVYCKILTYLMYCTYNFYPWCSVLNSIDRFISVKYQAKFKFRKELKNQLLVVAGCFMVFMLTNIPFILYEEKNSNVFCMIIDVNIGFKIYLVQLIVSSILPCTLMTISIIFSVRHLMAQRRKFFNRKNRRKYRRERNFLKNILFMEVWFLICYSPICIGSFLQYTLDFNYINKSFWMLLMSLFNILSLVQSTCNFFVFLMSNKVFRKYFLSIISSFKFDNIKRKIMIVYNERRF